ncbi:Apoptosis regulator BAX [Gryllus bimaculatus]|nr:Apoptosis regulator BAX [Gryllus bimaculatus]
MDEDSGIINDTDEFTDESSGTFNYNITRGYCIGDDSLHRRLFSRRRSMGDILSPVPRFHRRSSLQTPSRIHEIIQHSRSNSETCIRNSGTPGIGSELFVAFLQEEINRSNLQVPESLQNLPSEDSIPCGSEVVPEFLSLGTHLRLMADEFASSDHRRRVRQHAEIVPLGNLDAESFTDLLFGMFQQGGVTSERVLVLFIFCADLAMRALREHLMSCFNDVMNWSQIYIESWLTPWVQRHGGWAVVLERSVHEAYKAAVIGACMMSILALWTYIRTAGH